MKTIFMKILINIERRETSLLADVCFDWKRHCNRNNDNDYNDNTYDEDDDNDGNNNNNNNNNEWRKS